MRILIAEDESVVRDVARLMLKISGHEVLVAANGREALDIVEREHEGIDLVLTDVIMPLMGGKELAAHLASRFPATKILYMSGYTDDALMCGPLETGIAFLEKPFTRDTLIRSVNYLLAEKNHWLLPGHPEEAGCANPQSRPKTDSGQLRQLAGM